MCLYTHQFLSELKSPLLYKIELIVLISQDYVRIMEFYRKKQLVTAWPIMGVSDTTGARGSGPDIEGLFLHARNV